MSLRASSPPRPRPPPRPQASSGRRALDEVLRAGRAVGPAPVSTTLAKPSSLTASLKAMQVTPTGAPCVPLSFDPDYCSGDKFYAFGMAVVTTTVGALTAAAAVSGATMAVCDAVVSPIENMFYTRCSDVSWFDWLTYRFTREVNYTRTWESKELSTSEIGTFADTPFCNALAGARNFNVEAVWPSVALQSFNKFGTLNVEIAARLVAQQILHIIFAPVVFAMDVSDGPSWEIEYPSLLGITGLVKVNNLGRLNFFYDRPWTFPTMQSKLATFLGGVINMKWVHMIASKMNEMARGVASYMRVNFKQYLRDKTLYETNPLEFSRRILYDIVEDDAPEAKPEPEPGSPGSPPPLEDPDSPAYREWENPGSPAYREWENPHSPAYREWENPDK